MGDPLLYLSNVPGNTSSNWKQAEKFVKQYYNKQGDYEIGDGPEYPMLKEVKDWTPFVWHTANDPVLSAGDGTFQITYTGYINVLFKSRFTNDGTGIEYRLRVNENVIHTYRTPLVHNGGSVDSLMQHTFEVVENDIVRITAQAYVNPGSTTVQDFDDYGNFNTTIIFSR